MRGVNSRLAGIVVLVLALSLVAVPAAAGAQPATSMGQSKGNAARTGEQPGPGLSGKPALRWSYQPPASPTASFRFLPPVMADGKLYVAARVGAFPQVIRLDAKTGRLLPWKSQKGIGLAVGDVNEPDVASVALMPLALVDGVLYVPTVSMFNNEADRAELTAYDANTGTQLWRLGGYKVDKAVVPQPAGSSVAGIYDLILSPAIADGVAYIPVSGMSPSKVASGLLVAVDAHTGKELWHAVADGEMGTPSVANGRVYDGIFISAGNSTDSFTLAYDAKTGQQRWRAHVESIGQMPVVDGLVYTTTENQIVALNADTGAVEWQITAPAGTLSSAAVVNGTVYVTDLLSQQATAAASSSPSGALYALDAKTGKLRWSVGIDTAWFGDIAVTSGAVYLTLGNQNQAGPNIGHDAALLAFDAGTGKQLWRFTPAHAGNRYGSPTIVGGVAYVVTNTYVDALGGGLTPDSPIATAAASLGGRG